MAYDKVVDSAVLNAGLTKIGDAIREKAGTSDNLEFPDGMEAAINAIETGVSEAGELGTPTVDSAGLVTVEVIKGGVLEEGDSTTLQLSTQAAKTVTPSTSAQTAVAAGKYTTGAVTVAAMTTATQATPSITVSSAGLITASATQTAGYVAAGTKSATKQLTAQAAKTVTPSTSAQTAVAAGRYTTGAVTVAAIPSTYKRMATGTVTSTRETVEGTPTSYKAKVEVTGLGFTPAHVMLVLKTAGSTIYGSTPVYGAYDTAAFNSEGAVTLSKSYASGTFSISCSSLVTMSRLIINGTYYYVAWA